MNLIRTSVGDLKATQPDTRRKLYPFTQLAPSYEKKAEKKSKDCQFLYSVEGERIKDWDDKRMREPIWTNPCSGEDYLCLWCSHRFHEANIKATAGGKGQAETHEDNSRKGMRNAISVMKEGHTKEYVYLCMRIYSIYSCTAQHPTPTLPL